MNGTPERAGPLTDPLAKTDRAIVMLILSAAAALALIVAGGYSVYSNLRKAEFERGWVDHSQTVLTNLQMQGQRLDRIDYNLQLYSATGDRDNRRAVSATISAINLGLAQLQDLVKDNEIQKRHAQEFEKAVQELGTAVSRTNERTKTIPDREILACRGEINFLLQEERGFLRLRTEQSHSSSYRSSLVSIGFLGLSLFIVSLLFVFLFRDAARKRLDERRLFTANSELELIVSKLTERAYESTLLIGARDELQLCVTAEQAYESTVRNMHQLLPRTSGAALVINNSRTMVEIVSAWGEAMPLLDGFDLDCCCGLRAGKPRWRKPGQSELECGHFIGTPPENYLCVPLAAYGETMGFVFISFPDAECVALAESRTKLVVELVELASLSIAGQNLRAKLERQSIRDGLTGLFNRHFMEIALDRELHRAGRHQTPLAVLMMDVDHFKQFNDTYGHDAGDTVLRSVAECFRQCVREEDIICRYGGEEFLIIMPDVQHKVAVMRAQQILSAVADLRINLRGESLRPVTVSVGIAMYPEIARDRADLIRLADNALYRAKSGGRNQIQTASVVVEEKVPTNG